jgi:hypothetical protein
MYELRQSFRTQTDSPRHDTKNKRNHEVENIAKDENPVIQKNSLNINLGETRLWQHIYTIYEATRG